MLKAAIVPLKFDFQICTFHWLAFCLRIWVCFPWKHAENGLVCLDAAADCFHWQQLFEAMVAQFNM